MKKGSYLALSCSVIKEQNWNVSPGALNSILFLLISNLSVEIEGKGVNADYWNGRDRLHPSASNSMKKTLV